MSGCERACATQSVVVTVSAAHFDLKGLQVRVREGVSGPETHLFGQPRCSVHLAYSYWHAAAVSQAVSTPHSCCEVH